MICNSEAVACNSCYGMVPFSANMLNLVSLIFSLVFCVSSNAGDISFEAPVEPGEKVRFAVISDLTGGERDGVFQVAVNGLSKLQPDFVLTVGDLIEGGTEDINQLNLEWKVFTEKARGIGSPVYPTVGNHDISNVVQRNWFLKNIGPRYYHFRYKDYLFLILDSEDYSDERFDELAEIRIKGIKIYKEAPEKFAESEYANLAERKWGEIRDAQSEYFLKVINENKDARWTFVLLHKPAWEAPGDHNFFRIENALSGMQYTVFAGHVHAYKYTKRLDQDYIQLGTTGGAFTPTESGEYLDHILWVTMDESGPELVNLSLPGIRGKTGQIQYEGIRPCFAQEDCTEQ